MDALIALLKEKDHFAVISHVAPDGDTLGCAAALIMALQKMGKTCQWFCDGEIPENYMQFPEIRFLVDLPRYKTFDVAIAVDASDYSRLGNCAAIFDRASIKAQVDHHVTNTAFADVNLMIPYPATGLIILEIIDALHIQLDKALATALYIAICTDTGRLSYEAVNGFTVAQTARLYDAGAPVHDITNKLYNLRSYKKTKLIGEALLSLQLEDNGKIAYILLEQENYLRSGATSGDTEGIINYALQVEGVQIAAMLRYQAENIYKGSLRCQAPYNVANIAQKIGGGGHQFAAGFTVNGTAEQAITITLAAMREEMREKETL